MFTGIIEEVGTVVSLERGSAKCRLTLSGGVIFSDLTLGDSVAVNGVCLTADEISGSTFTADVMPETLSRSALGALRPGGRVNLERAMAANGRFGGHIVAGHIDGTGAVEGLREDGNAVWVRIRTGPDILRYIIKKGSIAIDGISLTVAAVDDTGFSVSVIPHTGGQTTLLDKRPGDVVNLENDMVGKYIEKLMQPKAGPNPQGGGLTLEFLAENGF